MSTEPALLAQFTALEVATVSDALDACRLPPGQGGLMPMWGRPKVTGFAVTVELEPLNGQPGADRDGAHILTGAIAGAGSGDVIVVANGGRTDVSSWGGIVSIGAAVRSVRGVITDGRQADAVLAGPHEAAAAEQRVVLGEGARRRPGHRTRWPPPAP